MQLATIFTVTDEIGSFDIIVIGNTHIEIQLTVAKYRNDQCSTNAKIHEKQTFTSDVILGI